jgi:hypothetical protein
MQYPSSNLISLTCVLILSSYLRVGIQSGPFNSDFPTNFACISSHVTRPAQFILLDLSLSLSLSLSMAL